MDERNKKENKFSFLIGDAIVKNIVKMCGDIPAIPYESIDRYMMAMGTLWLRENIPNAVEDGGTGESEDAFTVTGISCISGGDETKQPQVQVESKSGKDTEEYNFFVSRKQYEKYTNLLGKHKHALASMQDNELSLMAQERFIPILTTGIEIMAWNIPLEDHLYLRGMPWNEAEPCCANILYNKVKQEIARKFCAAMTISGDCYRLSPENLLIITDADMPEGNPGKITRVQIFYKLHGLRVEIYDHILSSEDIASYMEQFNAGIKLLYDNVSHLKKALDGLGNKVHAISNELYGSVEERLKTLKVKLTEYFAAEAKGLDISVSCGVIYKDEIAVSIYLKKERIHLWAGYLGNNWISEE